jgi:hypothetical protein
MKKAANSIEAILDAMPKVQEAVRAEIAERMAKGEPIYHAKNGKIMVNDQVIGDVKDSDPADAAADMKNASRKAA